MVTVRPPEAEVNRPVNIPINPNSLNPSIALDVRRYPKLVIGTVAPAPAQNINFLYIPRPVKMLPTTTKSVFKCVNLTDKVGLFIFCDCHI